MVNHYRYDFIGLSTDVKPTPADSEKVADGSTYYTSDDSKLYIWYKDQWYEKEGSEEYVLPTASSDTLGGVKVGEGLTIDSETGVLSTDGGGGGPTVVQTTGTSTTDVMSQDATTSMVYSDPSARKKIRIGYNSTANYDGQISIGSPCTNNSLTPSTAIGYNAYVSGNYSMAIGTDNPRVTADRATALGHNATVTANGGVAVGSGANAQVQGEFNIGSGNISYGYNNTNYRLLTGVHDPVNAHDAATKGYVDAHAGGGPTVVQTAGTSTTDVMSQNATSSLVYALHNGAYDKENIRIGASGQAVSAQPISIGYNARVSGSRAIAIGYNAESTIDGGLALGEAASVSGQGGIALGAKTTCNTQGVINVAPSSYSYGYNNTYYRLLSGLYDPQTDHDAATKGYVDGLISAIEARLTAGGL